MEENLLHFSKSNELVVFLQRQQLFHITEVLL